MQAWQPHSPSLTAFLHSTCASPLARPRLRRLPRFHSYAATPRPGPASTHSVHEIGSLWQQTSRPPAAKATAAMTATAAAMGSFASRQRAAEGHWFNTEGQLAVMRHLEKMVQQVRRFAGAGGPPAAHDQGPKSALTSPPVGGPVGPRLP